MASPPLFITDIINPNWVKSSQLHNPTVSTEHLDWNNNLACLELHSVCFC